MFIRQASSNDIDAVAALFDQYRVFYGKRSDAPRARHFIAERLRLNESVIFLAQTSSIEDGAPGPAGFVQLYPSFSSVSAARIYVLNDLFVAEAQRRLGLARQLMQAAQTYAHAAGAKAMRLSTDRSNHPAQSLYESLGWTPDEAYLHYEFALASRSAQTGGDA